MEPISTHAREASTTHANSSHSQDDLASLVGLKHKQAYLVTGQTGERFIGIVKKFTHKRDDWFNYDTGVATRPASTGISMFTKGILTHIEYYDIHSFGNGCVLRESEPRCVHETPKHLVEALEFDEVEVTDAEDKYALTEDLELSVTDLSKLA